MRAPPVARSRRFSRARETRTAEDAAFTPAHPASARRTQKTTTTLSQASQAGLISPRSPAARSRHLARCSFSRGVPPAPPNCGGPRPAGCGCVSGGPPRGCAVRARQRPPGLPSRRARTPKSQPNRTSPPSGAHWANDATPGGYRAQVSARFARPSCVGHLPPAARRGTAQFAGAAAGARRRSGRLSGGLLCSASRLWPGCSLPFSRGRRPWVVPPLPLFLSGFFRRFAPSGFRGLCRFFRWFRGSPPFPPRGRGWAARLPVPRFSGPSFSPGAAGGASLSGGVSWLRSFSFSRGRPCRRPPSTLAPCPPLSVALPSRVPPVPASWFARCSRRWPSPVPSPGGPLPPPAARLSFGMPRAVGPCRCRVLPRLRPLLPAALPPVSSPVGVPPLLPVPLPAWRRPVRWGRCPSSPGGGSLRRPSNQRPVPRARCAAGWRRNGALSPSVAVAGYGSPGSLARVAAPPSGSRTPTRRLAPEPSRPYPECHNPVCSSRTLWVQLPSPGGKPRP